MLLFLAPCQSRRARRPPRRLDEKKRRSFWFQARSIISQPSSIMDRRMCWDRNGSRRNRSPTTGQTHQALHFKEEIFRWNTQEMRPNDTQLFYIDNRGTRRKIINARIRVESGKKTLSRWATTDIARFQKYCQISSKKKKKTTTIKDLFATSLIEKRIGIKKEVKSFFLLCIYF